MNGPDPHGPWGSPSRPSAAGTSYAPPYQRTDRPDGHPPDPYAPPQLPPSGHGADLFGPGHFSPYAAPGQPPAPSRVNLAAVAGLAFGGAAVAMLGLAAGTVSAVAGVVGVVASSVGVLVAKRGRERTHGLAVAGVTTSAIAVALSGVVFLLSATGVGADLQASLGGDVELPMVALRPGEQGSVGDYTVTVDEIRMAADTSVTADRRNPPADGTYVEAVVTVTYVGRGVGIVEEDLLVSYVGSDDHWIYDEWGCAAITDRPVFKVDPIEPGATATFVSCMDVPAEVVDEAAVIVEDLRAPMFTAEMWGER